MLKNLLVIILTISLFLFMSRLYIFTLNALGIFAFGEPIFLLSALLLGPIHGALVGGIGFAVSSFLLGYPHYVIAALTVNFITGLIVGKINKFQHFSNFTITMASVFILNSFFIIAGTMIYSGEVYIGYTKDLFLGEEIMKSEGLIAYRLYISPWFWVMVGALIYIISFGAIKKIPKCLRASSALLAGCLTMILGYFLYEKCFMPAIFYIKVDATTNVVTHFGHSIISATISLLLYWAIKWLRGSDVS